MKLPNGYGSVIKLSGKRRNPYVVKVTTGWDDEGKQIRKCIGYTKTRKEGIELLTNYNSNPYDIDSSNLTFEEIYNQWLPIKEKKVSKKGLNRYTNAYKYYDKIKEMKYIDIKLPHLQKIIDDCEYGYHIKSDIKSLYYQLYDYANLLEVPIKKNYAEHLDIGVKEDSGLHSDFTNDEIEILWNNKTLDFVGSILIMIYTGLRPTELLTIEEFHLEEEYMKGGIKTEAGINRIIPINKKIMPLVESDLVSGKLKMTYAMYKKRFDKVMKQLNMTHTPHDCRHTFATLMDRAGANKLCIQEIMGHSKGKNVTDAVYIHKNLNDLKSAIELI